MRSSGIPNPLPAPAADDTAQELGLVSWLYCLDAQLLQRSSHRHSSAARAQLDPSLVDIRIRTLPLWLALSRHCLLASGIPFVTVQAAPFGHQKGVENNCSGTKATLKGWHAAGNAAKTSVSVSVSVCGQTLNNDGLVSVWFNDEDFLAYVRDAYFLEPVRWLGQYHRIVHQLSPNVNPPDTAKDQTITGQKSHCVVKTMAFLSP